MGHAAVTRADLHRFSETFARGGVGQAGVDADPFHAWIDSWEMRGLDAMDRHDYRAACVERIGRGFQLRAAARGRPRAGACRATPATAGNPSANRPRIITASRSSRRPAASPSTTGRSRSPGRPGWTGNGAASRWRPDQSGWDWLSLHLKTGEKLMLYRIRQTDGHDYCTGNWISPDGRSEPIRAVRHQDDSDGRSRRSGRASLPTAWRIEIPAHRLAIDMHRAQSAELDGHELSLLGRADRLRPAPTPASAISR